MLHLCPGHIVQRPVRIPTFHMFKGIPEGHVWDSFSPPAITGASLMALLAGPFSWHSESWTPSVSSFPASFEMELRDSSPSSELKSTSLSFSPGVNSPLHIFHSKHIQGTSSHCKDTRATRVYPSWDKRTISLQKREAESARHIIRNILISFARSSYCEMFQVSTL